MRYDPATALVIIDVQNDFADPGGSLSVAGGMDIVPLVNREAAIARAAGAIVAYTADWHPARTSHFARDGGIWPVHCVGGTWGAEFQRGLIVDGPVVRKGVGGEDGYSGFTVRDPDSGQTTPTELGGILRDAGASRVVLCGLATDYCVKATALDSVALGFQTSVLAAAIRAVDLAPGDGNRALGAMAAAGVTIVSATDERPAADAPAGNEPRPNEACPSSSPD